MNRLICSQLKLCVWGLPQAVHFVLKILVALVRKIPVATSVANRLMSSVTLILMAAA